MISNKEEAGLERPDEAPDVPLGLGFGLAVLDPAPLESALLSFDGEPARSLAKTLHFSIYE